MNPEEQKAYDKALERIEYCRRHRERVLFLDGLGLTRVPSELGKLTRLTQLYLHHNQLTTLPPEIWHQLTALSELYLGNNQLIALPSEIGQLKALMVLYLHHNQLTTLPPEIGQLTALRKLSLTGNQLTTLPPELGQLTALTGLDLSHNQFTTLPPELGRLTALTLLYLYNNRLATLPPELGQLTALTQLDLDNNQLTTLPPELGQLAPLQVLVLENNALRELPENLQQLTEIYELTLHGNNALGLPAEVLGPTYLGSDADTNPPANPAEILHYYFAQLGGPRRPLNEVKVLVVGESEVGKTSLIRQLRGESHNPNEDKTHGIERHRVMMPCGRLNAVRLNVWDFGGQDIMHATHQFFLTHRSVYLLVLDSRQNERQSRIDYWLRLIASYGGDSPVIVVCNKADQHVMQLNWTGLQRDYPQIKGYAREVCCYHYEGVDRRKGLVELKQLIAEVVARDLPEVDKPLLERWLNLKDELEQDLRPYLTLVEYHQLAGQRGILNQRDREVLLSLMHRLGSVLHFSEHAIFDRERALNAAPVHVEELNVLDPGWVTGAIYKLLNDPRLIRAGGTLDRGTMRQSLAELPSGRYPRDKEDFILAMMRRFEICFAFDGEEDRWFLPDLLLKDELDTGNWKAALGFRYQYRVLPGSVIGRLMVRLHKHIARHCLWRTGAKFKQGDCEALVRSEPEEARLDVFIRGGTDRERREFLALLRGTLADIHRSFSHNLGVEERVPVPGQPGEYVDYETLLLLEAEGTLTHITKVDGKLVPVDVDQALNGVRERDKREEDRQRRRQKRKKASPSLLMEPRMPPQAPPVPWLKRWAVTSLGGGVGAGAVTWVLLEWQNLTTRIVIGVTALVFVAMLLHNPKLRSRRLLGVTVGGWLAANGKAIAAGSAGAGASFNLAFVAVIVVLGYLAHREWEHETRGQ